MVESRLQDKSYIVRQAAVKALGEMKSRGSIPKLRVALDDNSPVVSFAAAQALWAMDDYSGASIFVQVLEGDRKPMPGLIDSQWHDMQQKLHDPIRLAEFGAAEAAGAFLGPGGFAVTAVENLAKDKTIDVRALSARNLSRDFGPQGPRSGSENALQDKSWIVRAEVADALGRAEL